MLLSYQVNKAFGFTRGIYELKNKQSYRYHLFFRADNYAVMKETLVIKYGTKQIEKRGTEMRFVNLMVDFVLFIP